jgi:hypothetical protein
MLICKGSFKKKNQRETNVNKWEARVTNLLRAGKLYAENG